MKWLIAWEAVPSEGILSAVFNGNVYFLNANMSNLTAVIIYFMI